MNKLIFLPLLFFLSFQINAQTGLQITTSCENDSLCLSANECQALNQFFSISATTDCSVNNIVEYNFFIDWNHDGTIDSLGATSNFTVDFPIGTHWIKFTAFDFCGGEESCEFIFEVMDCIAPVIETDYVLDTFIMPSALEIEFFPEHFISPSTFDNCTDYENLTFSISYLNTIDTSIFLNCGDLTLCNTPIPLSIWVEDESGNQDSINIGVVVLNTNGNCPGFAYYSDVEAQFWDGELTMENTNFELNGLHFLSSFESPPPCPNNSFIGDTIFPNFIGEVNPLNGVSTFDLVLISKHILGIELLDSPYQLIAADANNSGSITTLDLAVIRSLILHITDEFPSGESWVYDPTFIIIEGFEDHYYFTGIKLGDVSGNANIYNFQNSQVDTRTFNNTLQLTTKNQSLRKGEVVTVSTFAKNFQNIIGGQMTIDFDPTVLTFEKIEGASTLELNDQNFGKSYLQDGWLLCSWNTPSIQNLQPEEYFFQITFTAQQNGQLSDYFTINSKKLSAEIYVENENSFEFWNTELNFLEDQIIKPISISPHPFTEQTTIQFYLTTEELMELDIFDLNGRLIFSKHQKMQLGENNIHLPKTIFPTKGIYFYRIKLGSENSSGKLILQ